MESLKRSPSPGRTASPGPLASAATLTIVSSDSGPRFAPPPTGPITVARGQAVAVRLGHNWPSDAEIARIDLFHNMAVDGKDTKDEAHPAGSWTREDGADSALAAFRVSPGSGPQACDAGPGSRVLIRDIEPEAPGGEDKYCFGLSISLPGDPILLSVDPELINKG